MEIKDDFLKNGISIVIPVLNEEENIPKLYSKLKRVLNKLNFEYEISFIDDGSTDNTYNIIARANSYSRTHRQEIPMESMRA